MKLQKILLLVGFVIAQQNQVVAAQGSELDSAKTSVGSIGVCKKAYECQAYLCVVDQYMQATGDKTLFRKDNEVTDIANLRAIQNFIVQKVTYPFIDIDGNCIVAEMNAKSGRMGLPKIKNDPRFITAQAVLAMFEGHPVSLEKLSENYDLLSFSPMCGSCLPQQTVMPVARLRNRVQKQVQIASEETPSTATVMHGLQHLQQDTQNTDTVWLQNLERQTIESMMHEPRLRTAVWPRFTQDGKAIRSKKN